MSPDKQSDPVEVMARAIFAEQHPELDYDMCREATQTNYCSMARSALAAAEAAGLVMRREITVEFRYRLADLLRDLHQRKPEAIEAASEVIALFDEAASLTPQEKEQKT